MNRLVLAQLRAGAISATALSEVRTFEDGHKLDVPGHPTAIHVPGHTVGQTGFSMPDRAVPFVGDSLLTTVPLTGTDSDPKVGGFSEADIDQAKQSVRVLAAFEDLYAAQG